MRIFSTFLSLLFFSSVAHCAGMPELLRMAFSVPSGKEASIMLEGKDRDRVVAITGLDGPIEARALVLRRFGTQNCGRVSVYLLQGVPGSTSEPFVPMPGIEMNVCADGKPAEPPKD